ncbi:MAG TPA: DinB family protein [Bryobacteraceae bacterium]|nr:DinB family protein [Bryobacteraceae bacterium]
MKIDSEFLVLQLDYTRWANEHSLEAARALSEEELTRDLGNSYGGVLGTLLHIFHADRVWLSRLEGRPRATMADEGESWTLPSLAVAWADIAERYRAWASNVTDAQAILEYKNLAGKPGSLPLWQVIMHVVNHGTYHRGQITTMVRQLGKPPISTDLHIFYLTRG